LTICLNSTWPETDVFVEIDREAVSVGLPSSTSGANGYYLNRLKTLNKRILEKIGEFVRTHLV